MCGSVQRWCAFSLGHLSPQGPEFLQVCKSANAWPVGQRARNSKCRLTWRALRHELKSGLERQQREQKKKKIKSPKLAIALVQ